MTKKYNIDGTYNDNDKIVEGFGGKNCNAPPCINNQFTTYNGSTNCIKSIAGTVRGFAKSARFIPSPLCNAPPPKVNCVQSGWSSWSQCSAPCGGGTQTQTRSIITNAANGGNACGSNIQTQSCNTQPCPVDCVVSPWSSCSAACGQTGKITRTVITPASNGGKACPPLEDLCRGPVCPPPINCELTKWSPCSALCSTASVTGSQIRSIVVKAANGGKACPPDLVQPCNTQPCPNDCKVSEWTDSTQCSRLCSTDKEVGFKKQTRKIIENPQNGGKACPSNLEQIIKCNEQPCPIDCVMSEWNDSGSCSKPCFDGKETGTKKQTRFVIKESQYGGKACPKPSENIKYVSCNAQPCPIDCKVSPWSVWSECNNDTGLKTRNRTVLIKPQYGGFECPITSETIKCPIECTVSPWTKCNDELGIKLRTIKIKPKNTNNKCPSLLEDCPWKAKQDKYCFNKHIYNIFDEHQTTKVKKYDIEDKVKPICTSSIDNYKYNDTIEGKIIQENYCKINHNPSYDINGNKMLAIVDKYDHIKPTCKNVESSQYIYTSLEEVAKAKKNKEIEDKKIQAIKSELSRKKKKNNTDNDLDEKIKQEEILCNLKRDSDNLFDRREIIIDGKIMRPSKYYLDNMQNYALF